MTKITIIPYLGTTTKDRFLPGPFDCSITLTETMMITRQQYNIETPKFGNDEFSGYVDHIYNDTSYIPKDKIVQLGMGYDNEIGSFFLAVEKTSGKINSWNVESAEKGNELLNQLVEWWQS